MSNRLFPAESCTRISAANPVNQKTKARHRLADKKNSHKLLKQPEKAKIKIDTISEGVVEKFRKIALQV